jgi:hypothetical protein
MHERTYGQFARVLIDIDLLQPLRYKLLVERKGFAFFVDLEYEHIPDFCSECKIIGHNVDNCYRWKKDEEVRGNKDNIIKQKVSTKKAYVPISDGRVQHNKSKEHEHNNVETEIINVEESGNKSPQHLIEAINRDLVPADPVQEGTTSKQHNMLVTGPILAPVSPKSLLLAQDKQLENELNDDGDWSTDSQASVVKDSQDDDGGMELVEAACVEENHNKELVLVNTPSRVAKDMAFLKESWANMVEAEDDTNQMMEHTAQDEGFQIHLSKNKKKAQKKLMQSSRDSYATRSRVPPKPFR